MFLACLVNCSPCPCCASASGRHVAIFCFYHRSSRVAIHDSTVVWSGRRVAERQPTSTVCSSLVSLCILRSHTAVHRHASGAEGPPLVLRGWREEVYGVIFWYCSCTVYSVFSSSFCSRSVGPCSFRACASVRRVITAPVAHPPWCQLSRQAGRFEGARPAARPRPLSSSSFSPFRSRSTHPSLFHIFLQLLCSAATQ